MAINGSVQTNTCVSDFLCDIDLNGVIIFEAVADSPYEWTFMVSEAREKTNIARNKLKIHVPTLQSVLNSKNLHIT